MPNGFPHEELVDFCLKKRFMGRQKYSCLLISGKYGRVSEMLARDVRQADIYLAA